MNRQRILITLLVFAALAYGAQIFNKRPDPLYGYAVFGTTTAEELQTQTVSYDPAADREESDVATDALTKAHFIVLGRDVYFDANQNQVAERNEKFSDRDNDFQVVSDDGASRYRLTKAMLGLSPDSISESMPQHIILYVDVLNADQPESIRFQQAGRITVQSDPIDYGWAHFDGPLKFEFFDDSMPLPASGGPSINLRIAISTPSVKCSSTQTNEQNKSCSNPTSTIPGTLVPTATIEFPSGLSEEPITKRYDLDQFC